MTTVDRSRRHRTLSLAVVCLWLLAGAPSPTSAAEPTSAVEMEFWRSAERLGTVDAYQAYLAAFPRGTFAPLARAAIEKGRGGAAEPPAAGAVAGEVRPFREEASGSGSIAFMLGDRFVGPGPVMVGWAGAKKQILLPPGEWVVLAAIDTMRPQAPLYVSNPVPVRAGITSVVMARLRGTDVATLLRYSFSNRRVIVGAWNDIEGCDEAGAASLSRSRVTTAFGEDCASIRPVDDVLATLGDAADETRRSLARLGGRLPARAAVRATATRNEQKLGYLGITRIDFPAGGASADWLRRMDSWLQGYRKVAFEGLNRNIDADALAPGVGGVAPGAIPGVGDFGS